jgi:hypothetical protein
MTLTRNIPTIPTAHGAERFHPGFDGERIESLVWGEFGQPGVLCPSCRDSEAISALEISSNAGLITESRGRDTVTQSVFHNLSERFPEFTWTSKGTPDKILAVWATRLDHASDIQPNFPVMQTVANTLAQKLSASLPESGTSLRVIEMTSIPYRLVSWSLVTVSA